MKPSLRDRAEALLTGKGAPSGPKATAKRIAALIALPLPVVLAAWIGIKLARRKAPPPDPAAAPDA